MSNKTIGQYFSGPLVSDLLVAAASLGDTRSIFAIDPMVGKADMLEALRRAGACAERLYGIDIDSAAIASASTIVPNHNLLSTDAFSEKAVELYRLHEWDLVITNPPYVRYQKLNTLYGDNPVGTVRRLLKSTIGALNDDGLKQQYLYAAEKYSGLADLAVPCWILCAYLVRPGGKLAMVLPDSWLNREYSSAIHEILANDFTVERIIIDESRSWFKDAQVKTSLLVATKMSHVNAQPTHAVVRHISLTKHAANTDSLVGSLAYRTSFGVDAFYELCKNDDQYMDDKVWARNECLFVQGCVASYAEADHTSTGTLRDWGINVGQGLRTGANGFFYFTLDDNGFATNTVWKDIVGNNPIAPNKLPLIPVLRYQDDLGDEYLIDAHTSKHYLLLIDEPVSIEKTHSESSGYAELSRYIAYCESHDIPQRGRKVFIPNLSAVRTNGPTSKTLERERYWYMLPQLKDRHRPDLVIPRINGGFVRAFLLPEGEKVTVDANFSTIWVDSRSRTDAYVALALLNSTYVRLMLEVMCNVLGGGALKCEAVSIRKIALPAPDAKLRATLLELGRQLAKTMSFDDAEEVQYGIDRVIAETMTTSERVCDLITKWRNELDLRVKIRNER